MPNTKAKIITAAQHLFNCNGLRNTTLQTIADEVGISVGNLAYHYKNKQEIISAHTLILEEKLQEALTHFRNFPNFLDFQIQLQLIFDIQEQFSYLFRNQGEIALDYPATFHVLLSFRNKLQVQIESRIEYHVEKGNLLLDQEEDIHLLANTLTHYILSSQIHVLHNDAKESKFLYRELWALLKVHLSSKGENEYQLLIRSTM